MIDLLKNETLKHGDKFQILSIERLNDLKTDIEEFRTNEHLNGFQNYITENLYTLEQPTVDFIVRSILIIASPTPAYAKVIFNWEGKKIPVLSLARSYVDKKDALETTTHYLTNFLKPRGYHIQNAPLLP